MRQAGPRLRRLMSLRCRSTLRHSRTRRAILRRTRGQRGGSGVDTHIEGVRYH